MIDHGEIDCLRGIGQRRVAGDRFRWGRVTASGGCGPRTTPALPWRAASAMMVRMGNAAPAGPPSWCET